MKKPMKARQSLFQSLAFGLKVAIMFEVAVFVGSYVLWRKMNRDRDFRYIMYQKAPHVLHGYYFIGETFGDKSIRDTDYTVWGIKK